MIRKTIFAIAATAAIVATALPTDASAKKWGKHNGFWLGVGIATVGTAIAASCLQYQWVETRRGPRYMLVNACAY
jgi:fucose permease